VGPFGGGFGGFVEVGLPLFDEGQFQLLRLHSLFHFYLTNIIKPKLPILSSLNILANPITYLQTHTINCSKTRQSYQYQYLQTKKQAITFTANYITNLKYTLKYTHIHMQNHHKSFIII
jgi:hypothetical protein